MYLNENTVNDENILTSKLKLPIIILNKKMNHFKTRLRSSK